MMLDGIRIFVAKHPNPPMGWKPKMGVFGWNGDDLYLAACAVGMSEKQALMCCSYDGETVCQAEGTILVPESWARRERPDLAAVYDEFRKKAMLARESSSEMDDAKEVE